jgi:hypothetical protein
MCSCFVFVSGLVFCFLRQSLAYRLTWTGSYFVAQAGLELSILLPQPLECWEYRHAAPCLAKMWIFRTHSSPSTSLGSLYLRRDPVTLKVIVSHIFNVLV